MNPPQTGAKTGPAQLAEAAHQLTFKPFKISKEATAAQRRAERQADAEGPDQRAEEFGMLWLPCAQDAPNVSAACPRLDVPYGSSLSVHALTCPLFISCASVCLRRMSAARKWCSHDPFKPIWRPAEPKERPAVAKRKAREDAEQAAAEEAALPRHMELDRWLHHTPLTISVPD
jgi:hypothetical protein